MTNPTRGTLSLIAALALAACAGVEQPASDRDAPRLAPQEIPAAGAPHPSGEPLTRIAFGSCSDEDMAQPIWSPVLESAPDLWVWLGDNIYADTEDMSVMAAKYEMQLREPGYEAVRARMPVVGTWDDHDYGLNNGGREYPMRSESQQLLLDFLGVPDASPRRDRAGVYAAHTYGPPGQRVKVLLLDVRYHREAPGPDATMLGEEQWRWLESELRGSDAQIHVIGSGIQVLPVDHRYEKWANFPAERERLLATIADTGAPGVILLSGDRHIAEIMRLEDPRIGYPLYEVTSSGMTHSWEDASEPNRYRVGDLMTRLNFGIIEIDWAGAGEVVLQVRDRQNAVAVEERVPLGALRAGVAEGV